MAELSFKQLSKTPSRSISMIVGEVDEGKTSTGMSVSKKFDPSFSKPVLLDDTLFITNERDPFEWPKAKGIDTPYWLDLTEFPGRKEFPVALVKAVSMAKELASKRIIENVVIDSLSSIDKAWRAHKTEAGLEKWALIDALLVEHRRFLMEQLFSIPARIILVSHIKKIGDALTEDKDKMASLGLNPDDKFAMDISGWDAPKLYREQCSYIIPLRRTYNKGKPDEVFLYPRGVGGIEHKGKYAFGSVSEKEPANLAAFFEKISKTASMAA